jgi:hypothetical protein
MEYFHAQHIMKKAQASALCDAEVLAKKCA